VAMLNEFRHKRNTNAIFRDFIIVGKIVKRTTYYISIVAFLSNIKQSFRVLLPLSAAVYVLHIIFRALLLFRSDAYGIPFVGKPDWYIFHAIALDYLWIIHSLIIFSLAGIFFQRFSKILFIAFHSIILFLTLLDHEIQRFLGTHITFSLIDTYKDPSSVKMFWDYVAYDYSIPYLQFAVLALILPAFYFLSKVFSKFGKNVAFRTYLIALPIFYAICFLFLNVIWPGNARLKKLTPVVNLVWQGIANYAKSGGNSITLDLIEEYQQFWLSVDGSGEWKFTQKEFPLWKEPVNPSQIDLEKAPNFIIVFLESHRYMGIKQSSPFLDSLMDVSLNFNRMHVSGLPTTGGMLASHTGIVTHSAISQVTNLPYIKIPSFASYLRDAGYMTDYFSAADPAWDNLGKWIDKWYSRRHYDRSREDDSSFWDYSSSFVKDSLANKGKPFLATFMTRSNHYPFNFVPGMPNEEKDKPIKERFLYTMNYADRQFSRFARSIEKEPWYANTCLIVTADHGFPTGENGNSTMSGGAFYSSTWIPLIISCPFLEAKTDTISSSQIDIAPTILELAGLRVSNPFMGRSLLNPGKDFALGTHFGYKTINLDGYRLLHSADNSYMYAISDSLQENNLLPQKEGKAKELEILAEKIVRISDWALEKNAIDAIDDLKKSTE
jgi:phosphoglycerol transferase MdoB-like AlkP superfamily enzyme